MSKELTPEDIHRYVYETDQYCPYCGSNDLEPGSVDWLSREINRKITCNTCGEFWFDIYRLTNIRVLPRRQPPERKVSNGKNISQPNG